MAGALPSLGLASLVSLTSLSAARTCVLDSRFLDSPTGSFGVVANVQEDIPVSTHGSLNRCKSALSPSVVVPLAPGTSTIHRATPEFSKSLEFSDTVCLPFFRVSMLFSNVLADTVAPYNSFMSLVFIGGLSKVLWVSSTFSWGSGDSFSCFFSTISRVVDLRGSVPFSGTSLRVLGPSDAGVPSFLQTFTRPYGTRADLVDTLSLLLVGLVSSVFSPLWG